ncbi:MAG: tetratricopeptide repeat protein [Deltaproteobacteria bacterium]|nr:tetratricopeptide repeat protein [Deltaproteobacteria bacterium]MBK8713498.1 tetratricopeptide repeat protein [Deltaproteobacteria bacterium]MBP7289961.1 tetratricopeptide repeat protein [Nannocystaceae bacterium]
MSAASPSAHAGCPSEEQLGEFLAGDASDEVREQVEQHIDRCARCAQTVALFGGAFSDRPAKASAPSPSLLHSENATQTQRDGDEPSVGREPPRIGSRFADRYEIRACVGFGAGGTVYAAYDPELDRRIALKLLRVAGGRREAKRWNREAKIMARVVHPNVVAVHDVGERDGQVFIAAEFVDGSTLDAWRRTQARSWREILDAYVAAGRGLAAIHACGLVHRDFKPHNVLVGRDGRVCVTDFGLAQLQDDRGHDESGQIDVTAPMPAAAPWQTHASLTRTGTVVGTPAYMAPEQWRGEIVDARADQFAFAVALFEALFDQRPWAGRTPAELAAAVAEAKVTIPTGREVPRWLTRALMPALAREADARYADMNALLEALVETPRRARHRISVGAVAIGIGAVAAGGWALGRTNAVRHCDGDGGIEQAWGDPGRAALREHWAALPADVFDATAGRVDDWITRWYAAREPLCRGETIDATTGTLQLRCFDRRASELSAALAVARELPPDDALELDLLAGVEDPESCNDGARLAAIAPVYGSVASHVLALQLGPELDRCEALRYAGRHDEALALALAVLARAEIDGDHAVRAPALLELGRVWSQRKEAKLAEDALRKAVWAAEASGHVEAAADAWAELVNVLGVIDERPEPALEASERADAALFRLHDPSRDLSLRSHRAVVESVRGRYEIAFALQRDVLAHAEEMLGDKAARQMPRIHLNIAAVVSHLGRFDEAVEHARIGIALQEQLYPWPHGTTAEMYNSLGAIEIQRGNLDAGREALEHARAIAVARLPEDNPTIITIDSNLAGVALQQGRLDDAIAAYQHTLAMYRSRYGDTHPDVALAMHNLAHVLDQKGQRDDAITLYRQALALRLEVSGDSHPGTANTMHNLGHLLIQTGDPGQLEEGIALLEKALLLREQAHVDPWRRASTGWALTKAYDAHHEPERARAAAERARSLLGETPAAQHRDFAAKLDAWLATHPAG